MALCVIIAQPHGLVAECASGMCRVVTCSVQALVLSTRIVVITVACFKAFNAEGIDAKHPFGTDTVILGINRYADTISTSIYGAHIRVITLVVILALGIIGNALTVYVTEPVFTARSPLGARLVVTAAIDACVDGAIVIVEAV